jgi:4-amino-4-deoxy-L-arabinose transferase-like glycosyltransferase
MAVIFLRRSAKWEQTMGDSENGVGLERYSIPKPSLSPFLRFGSSRARRIIGVVALTLVAGICCFFRLSEGTLFGDEAAFACTTDRMQSTGDWIVPFLADRPHLNATPLYNWLTLAVAPWLDQTPLWYRFWSGAFGVGCVLMAYALGTVLFRVEVGLLAGLFTVFNRDFLFCHGIRFGGMDAMLTFFISGAAVCYVWIQTSCTKPWFAWGSLGLFIGLACLSKPPVFGIFFLILMTLHWVATSRLELPRVRIAGPLLAVAVSTIVAAPWYVLLYARLGAPALHALFVYNSLDRALDATLRDPFCCHRGLWHASIAFKLTGPALVGAIGCWLAKEHRPQWGLVLFLAGGYLLALTAAGKAGNYIYYVFPLLAVLVAGFLLESGPRLVGRFWPRLVWVAPGSGLVLAAVLVTADGANTLRLLAGPAWVHPPVAIYRRLAPDLEPGRCRLVLFDFPTPNGMTTRGTTLGNFEDLYYPPRMPLAQRVRDVKELSTVLSDGTPAFVLLPPRTTEQPQLTELDPEVRVETNPWPCYTYPVLAFNGAAAKICSAELVWLARGSQP